MSQHLVKVRVRPLRFAVLFPEQSTRGFQLATEFLSRIWGGRYGVLIPARTTSGTNVSEVLSKTRPDVVFRVGLRGKRWTDLCIEACQPHGIQYLTKAYINQLDRFNHEGVISARCAIAKFFQDTRRTDARIGVPNFTKSSHLAQLFMASFGHEYPQPLRDYYRNALSIEQKRTDRNLDFCKFVQHCSAFSGMWTWLDVCSYGLNRLVVDGGHAAAPTIVLIGRVPVDLSVYWNIRMERGVGSSDTIIPMPVAEIKKNESITAIVNWLKAAPIETNVCHVVSATVRNSSLSLLQRRLKQRLRGTQYSFVDVYRPSELVPLILPYDSEQSVQVTLEKRVLTWEYPEPQMGDNVTIHCKWIVDFLRDQETQRALGNICPPKNEVAIQVLNAPSLPNLPNRIGIRQLGYGIDSLNMVCQKTHGHPRYRWQLPDSTELLEELLREANIEPRTDEKRKYYEVATSMFGGLEQAARAFSGLRRCVLQALKDGPLTVDQIKSKCRLGSGNLADRQLPDLDQLLKDATPAVKRITKKRFDDYWEREYPYKEETLQSVLEHWLSKAVLKRKWHCGKCRVCEQQYWAGTIPETTLLICPACERRFPLPTKVPLGYELNPAIARALEEGIAPVILTGRFLSNLTNRGFQWLPGVRGRFNDAEIDIDFVACCDGHIVMGECKTLADDQPSLRTWSKIISQFKSHVNLATNCNVALVVLAALTQDYPRRIKLSIERVLRNRAALLLLDRADLEQGRRMITTDGLRRPVAIDDCLMASQSSTRRHRRRRRISYGIGEYSW